MIKYHKNFKFYLKLDIISCNKNRHLFNVNERGGMRFFRIIGNFIVFFLLLTFVACAHKKEASDFAMINYSESLQEAPAKPAACALRGQESNDSKSDYSGKEDMAPGITKQAPKKNFPLLNREFFTKNFRVWFQKPDGHSATAGQEIALKKDQSLLVLVKLEASSAWSPEWELMASLEKNDFYLYCEGTGLFWGWVPAWAFASIPEKEPIRLRVFLKTERSRIQIALSGPIRIDDDPPDSVSDLRMLKCGNAWAVLSWSQPRREPVQASLEIFSPEGKWGKPQPVSPPHVLKGPAPEKIRLSICDLAGNCTPSDPYELRDACMKARKRVRFAKADMTDTIHNILYRLVKAELGRCGLSLTRENIPARFRLDASAHLQGPHKGSVGGYEFSCWEVSAELALWDEETGQVIVPSISLFDVERIDDARICAGTDESVEQALCNPIPGNSFEFGLAPILVEEFGKALKERVTQLSR